MTLDLDQLTDQPCLEIDIGGRTFRFSELPIEALGRLQAVIKTLVPHPIAALAGQLDGLCDLDRQYLLQQARIDAKSWPPVIGTADGAAALLGSESGQIETLYEGLRVHQPATTREEARRIFRLLRKQSARDSLKAQRDGREYDGEGPARRIFGTLFGLDDTSEEDGRLPKKKIEEAVNINTWKKT